MSGHVTAQQIFAKEVTRKSVHLAIAFAPALASWNYYITLAILSLGIIIYIVNESARMRGRSDGIISLITEIASRPTERGFIWGPVTLGLGALVALLCYPDPVATVAIYALAFGDGIASLARLRYKTALSGFFLCFMAVFVSSYIVLKDLRLALISATVATGLELIMVQDLDNIIIPLGTGLALALVM